MAFYRWAAVILMMVLTLSGCGQLADQGNDQGVDQGAGEPNDIVNLIQSRQIEVDPQGSDIDALNLKVRRLVDRPVTVHIPVGTYFVAGNASSQNMIATSEESLTLGNDDWQAVSIATACTNSPRNIPGAGDHFSVHRAPSRAELAKLMPVLVQEQADYATNQAAIWIVTDNLNYAGLGELVETPGNQRLINQREAAGAMRLCKLAGIDIRAKAIWWDRDRILQALAPDDPLKKWLQSQ